MLEQSQLRKFEARCTQEAPPRCRRACPLDLDIRAFLAAMAASRFDEARRLLERHLPMPEILCAICDHPCQSACLRRELGGSIAIGELERFCLANAASQTRILPRPPKKQRAAILGAGLAGLTAANDLGRKGWPVTLYDFQPDEPLLAAYPALNPAVVANEWRKLEKNRVSFKTLSGSDAPEALVESLAAEYDAVFVDVSRFACAPGRVDISPVTLLWRGNVCAGGWLEQAPDQSFYPSAAAQAGDGRVAAITMQRILSGVSLDAERGAGRAGELHVDLNGVTPVASILPADGQWTASEAAAEAARCLQCTCLQCVRKCVYMQKYKEYPRLYARKLFGNATVVKGTRTSGNLVMNGCAACGQCEAICPEGFSMADLCLAARRDAVERDVMPPSAHSFALEDMAQATAPECAFFAADPALPEGAFAAHVFFPGCQLAGARPRQTLAMHNWLRDNMPDGVALWSSCCGIPAQWAGAEAKFTVNINILRAQWQEAGKPEIIAACSSCKSTLQKHLPEACITSLWEILDQLMPQAFATDAAPARLAMHDPCGARHDAAWRNATRSLAAKAGVELVETADSGETTPCCGYGGLVWNAQPDLANAMTQARAEEFAALPLTSCIMCRDRFAAQTGVAWHLFDILPQTANVCEQFAQPGLSSRRAGRVALRAAATGMDQDEAGQDFRLYIAPEVLASLERDFILRQDVEAAVRGIESTGAKFVDAQSGHFLGSWRPGRVTFWVQYKAEADGVFTLLRAWCHRMAVPGAIQPASELELETRIRA